MRSPDVSASAETGSGAGSTPVGKSWLRAVGGARANVRCVWARSHLLVVTASPGPIVKLSGQTLPPSLARSLPYMA